MLQVSEPGRLILMPKFKQAVTQYKIWNEVMLWLTQMMFYNVYIPFLILEISQRGAGYRDSGLWGILSHGRLSCTFFV